MKKKWRQMLVIAFLLILVLVLALWFSINGIIREQVDTRATAALGVQTTLNNVSLNILGGSLVLKGMTIANPPGFGDPHLLQMKTCMVSVKIGSLLTKTVQINTIAIDGMTVSLDQHGLSSNIQTVLNNINKNTAAPAPASGGAPAKKSRTQQKASGGKQLAINQVVLTNLTVIVRPVILPGQKGLAIPLHFNKLVIPQPTNSNGRPLRIADLFGQILGDIVVKAASSTQIPPAFRNSLKDAGGILKTGAGALLKGSGSLEKSVGNTFKAFGNLIPGQKKNSSGAAK